MKRLFTMAIAALPALAMAQVGLDLNLNRQNLQLFNASAAGLDDKLNTGFFYKSYWPNLTSGGYSMGVMGSYRIEPMAAGVGIHYTMNSKSSFLNEHRIAASFAKHHKVGSGTLSFGTDVTFIHQDVDFSNMTFSQFIDPTSFRDGSTLDLGAGLIYQSSKFETGLSVKNAFQADLFGYRAPREFFGHMLYHFEIGENLKFTPVAIFSTVEAFYSTQVNTRLTLRDKYWIMAGYKSRNAWVAGAGVDLPKGFRIAYNYDQSISRLPAVSAANHEITFGFRIPDKPIK